MLSFVLKFPLCLFPQFTPYKFFTHIVLSSSGSVIFSTPFAQYALKFDKFNFKLQMVHSHLRNLFFLLLKYFMPSLVQICVLYERTRPSLLRNTRNDDLTFLSGLPILYTRCFAKVLNFCKDFCRIMFDYV